MPKIACACALFLIAAVPGAAAARPFDGPRVEAHLGYDGSSSRGASSGDGDSVMPGVGIGYDFELGGIVIGPEVNVDFPSGRSSYAGTGPFLPLEVRQRRDVDLSVRVGAKFGPSTLFYGKVGYDNARSVGRYGPAGTRSARNDEGLRLGVGVEQRLGGSAFAKLEYRYTNYGDLLTFRGFQSRNQAVGGVGIRF